MISHRAHRRQPADLEALLRSYHKKLVAQDVPKSEIRKRIHLKAKSWLTQAMDWRMNPVVSTGTMIPGEYRSNVALEPQKFSMNGMGDWIPVKANMPESADGSQGTWLSPSQVPKRDRESDAKLLRSPEAFGGLGQPVSPESLLRGEYRRQVKLANQQFNLSGMGQPVPVGSLSPGEYERRVRLRQKFALSGLGQPVSPSAMVPGEYERRVNPRQRFRLRSGLGQPVSPSAMVPGEYERRVKLTGQQFGGLGQPVPISDMSPGEFRRRVRPRQQFRLSSGLGADAGQGSWLSPDQAPAWERASAASISGPEKFNLGDYEANRDVPISAMSPGEYRSRVRAKQKFGLGQMSPAAAAQIAALQAQAAAIAANYMRPSSAQGSAQGGAPGAPQQGRQMYVDPSAAYKTAFIEREFQLPKVCDPRSGTCIQYKHPNPELLASAYTRGQAQLPAFYAHPQLGPWGVDPRQAYQYWAAQQAALEAMPFQSTMSIFGSPGLVANTPGPLPASNTARPAAFDPYTQAFPTSGTAVERF